MPTVEERVLVWKHDCVEDIGGPCVPQCEDPWMVDIGERAGAFGYVRFADAVDFAHRWARQIRR